MGKQQRIFLVIADASPEMSVALRYATNRARLTGDRVALLYVMTPQVIQTWPGIEQMFTDEEVTTGKAVLREHEDFIAKATGEKPIYYIKRGDTLTALLELLDKQPDISVLVLSASTGPKGPGPLVSYLTSLKGIGKLKIPLVIVPDTYQLDNGTPPM